MRKRMLPKLSDVTKGLLILLLITLCDQSAFSQNNGKVDSLLLAVHSSKDDTSKVNTLIALSTYFLKTSNYTDSKEYAENSLKLAEKVNFSKGIVMSHMIIGHIYSDQGINNEALQAYRIALHVSEENGYKKGIADTYLSIGKIDSHQGNYDEALKKHLIALNMYEDIENKEGIGNSYSVIGNIYFEQGNYDEALKKHLIAINIYDDIEDKEGIGNSYLNIGKIYYRQGNNTEALKNILASLKIRQEIGDKKGISTSYNVIGVIYLSQGNYTEALKNILASLKIRQEIGDKQGISTSYINIGNIYANQGNSTEALNNYMASLKIKQEIGDKQGISTLYNNIGIIYSDQGNYTEALKHYLSSLKISEENGNKIEISNTKANIGSIYYDQKNCTEALKYYLSSLKISEEIGHKRGISNNKLNIGIIYSIQGNYTEALNNYMASLQIFEEIGDQHGIALSYINLGNVNIELNRPAEAKKYLDNGLSLSIELGIKTEIMRAYERLAQVNSIMGNYMQALEHYKLYTIYKDSLSNEENSEQITEMQIRYETEKKDKEILLLQSEKQISDLELAMRGESIHRIQADNDRIQLKHMLSLQQLDLLSQQQELQQCALEQNQASLTIQEKETALRQDQLNLVNKENEIKTLALKREKLTKNYMFTGIVLLTMLSLVVYNNFKTRQQLKLQTLRNKIASDLHDDVGSTLSSIHIFSEMARNQSKEVLPMLDTISESSKKMMDAMADIVWTINPDNDNFEKIMDRMRSFAYELLLARKIDFEFDAKESLNDLKLSMEARKNLYLIFKEATNNMVKYSNADKAHFSLTEAEKMLTMIIHDNGKGFDMQSASSGNGLRNMKKRAEEIGGALRIDSSPGDGTTIQLSVAV